MVECQLPKLQVVVRVPSPAPFSICTHVLEPRERGGRVFGYSDSSEPEVHVACCSKPLMAHRVNDNVHADLIGHHAILRGIAGIVDPLECVTQVTVTRHENHEPSVLVLDAHVMRRHAALFVSHTLKQCRPTGYLDYLIQ